MFGSWRSSCIDHASCSLLRVRGVQLGRHGTRELFPHGTLPLTASCAPRPRIDSSKTAVAAFKLNANLSPILGLFFEYKPSSYVPALDEILPTPPLPYVCHDASTHCLVFAVGSCPTRSGRAYTSARKTGRRRSETWRISPSRKPRRNSSLPTVGLVELSRLQSLGLASVPRCRLSLEPKCRGKFGLLCSARRVGKRVPTCVLQTSDALCAVRPIRYAVG